MHENDAVRAASATRRQALLGWAVVLGGVAFGSTKSRAATDEEISHTAEAIHQENRFKASRKRVYAALTDSKQFHQVTQLSAAMQSGMSPAAITEIGNEAGRTFSLFGGYISGRQIELVPDERIVQAWRVAAWNPGVYSIAKFELTDDGYGSKIVFDHTGFPKGQGEHLAAGWKANYWDPLEKYLAL
jgi:activator of HSP90 ATPase